MGGTPCRGASFRVFSQDKIPPVSRELICNETLLQKLSLVNIMKHDESDLERQISIQGIPYVFMTDFFLLWYYLAE